MSYRFPCLPAFFNSLLAPDDSGGGMANVGINGTEIYNCNFSGNYAYYGGGGMGNDGSTLTISNSVFEYNYAYFGGGAMSNYNHSSSTIT